MPSTSCRNIVLLTCVAGTCVVWGQRFSYGVKAGATLNEPARLNPDESKRYVVGATAEYRLWNGFAVEADLFYHRNGSEYAYTYNPFLPTGEPSGPPVSIASRFRLNVFELPLVGKYSFRRDTKLAPFILTGYSFRKAFSDSENTVTTQSVTTRSSSSSSTPWDIGASLGVGFRWRVGHLSLSPEIRYTEWGGRPDQTLSKRQVNLLFGITF